MGNRGSPVTPVELRGQEQGKHLFWVVRSSLLFLLVTG